MFTASTPSETLDEWGQRSEGSGVHPKPLRIGDRIDGKYIVRRTLGSGGWAVVYEAEHVVMKHCVAIKVLRPDEEGHALALERFRREARLSASIRHPNVLEVYDVGHLADGSPYLVMELLRGEDLDTRLASGPLHVAEVLDVGDQLMSALDALRARGIVHRDVKPHNLFLQEQADGELVLKLLDFGIARETEAVSSPASRLTTKGELLGTPHYMAPEQLKNEHMDSRTDLYAASVVLYELLAGVTPFEEPTQSALIASVLRDPVPDLRRYRPDCPDALAALIYKGLEKDIALRWSTPDEMQREMRRIREAHGHPAGTDAWSHASRVVTSDDRESSLSTLARDGTPAARVPGRARSQRSGFGRPFGLLAGALVALSVSLGWWSGSEAEPTRAAEKKAFAVKAKLAAERAPTDATRAEAVDPSDATRAGPTRARTSEPNDRGTPRATRPAPRATATDVLRRDALAAYVRGQLPRARILFRRAAAADPADEEAWRGLGLVATAMGRPAEARTAFERYLRLAPTAPDAPRIRARLAAL
jgi:serine/threonine-protein kinase